MGGMAMNDLDKSAAIVAAVVTLIIFVLAMIRKT